MPACIYRVGCRFRLRTLLVVVPFVAWLSAWAASRPLEEVDTWVVVDDRSLLLGSTAAARQAGSRETGQVPHATAIKRRALIMQALETSEVANLPLVQHKRDAIRWLRDELTVEFYEQNNLVRLSLRGRDPDQLAIVLDSVAATYARSRDPSLTE